MSEPRTTALLFVECQRGVVGDLSVLPALAEAARPTLAVMGRLATGARGTGVQVVHLTYLPLAGGRSASRRSPLMRATAATASWVDGDPALEVVTEIGVGPHDLVLPRHQGISPVHRTEVLAILRNMGMTEVVVAGVSTNLAIPASPRWRGRRGLCRHRRDGCLCRHPARAPFLHAQAQLGVRRPPGHGGRAHCRVVSLIAARRWPWSRGTARAPRSRTDARYRSPCSRRRASRRRTTCRR